MIHMQRHHNAGKCLFANNMMMIMMMMIMWVDAATVTERVFLDDNIFAEDKTRPSPVELGHFLHQCLGNVSLCPNGFTWSAWYKPLTANRQVIRSTGFSYCFSLQICSAAFRSGIDLIMISLLKYRAYSSRATNI